MSTRRSSRRNKASPEKEKEEEEVEHKDAEAAGAEKEVVEKVADNGEDEDSPNGGEEENAEEVEAAEVPVEEGKGGEDGRGDREVVGDSPPDGADGGEKEVDNDDDDDDGGGGGDDDDDGVEDEEELGDDDEEDDEVAKIMSTKDSKTEEEEEEEVDDDEDEVKEVSSGDDIAEITEVGGGDDSGRSESSPEIVSLSSSSDSDKKNSKSKDEPEVVELTDDDEESLEDDEEEEGGSSEEEEEEEDRGEDDKGDPDREPGADAGRYVDPDHLVPFRMGWKREVVSTKSKKASSIIDIYYVPPQDTKFRTREAKRKRISKADQEKYFEDFPSKELSIINFNYVRRPLSLNNAAYEIVRKRRKDDPPSTHQSLRRDKRHAKSSSSTFKAGKRSVNYKEVEEYVGLMEDTDSDDGEEKINFMRGLDVDLPLCLQIATDAPGMRAEHKRRRRHRDPETCCTPPLAEDMLWSEMDEDPVGIYNDLGGRSSPATPPPLRAVKLMPVATVEKIAAELAKVREEAAKMKVTVEPEMKESMASHDAAITKWKDYVERRPQPWQYGSSFPNSFVHAASLVRNLPGISLSNVPPMGGNIASIYQRQQLARSRNRGSHHLMHLHPGTSSRRRVPNPLLQNRPRPGSWHQPSIMNSGSNLVKVKLPMRSINGKRPIVELVMEQGGRYQPIKFSNNMQVTEAVPKALFDRANAERRTVYQRATQVPRIGDRNLYLAVNPSPTAASLMSRSAAGSGAAAGSGPRVASRYEGLPKFRIGDGKPIRHTPRQQPTSFRPRPHHHHHQNRMSMGLHPQSRAIPHRVHSAAGPSPSGPPPQGSGDQVAILVKPQKGPSAKHVLLNVPRRVAIKVKPGTTLSFSASNDQKYVVVDSKIHPPVGSKSAVAPAPAPASQRGANNNFNNSRGGSGAVGGVGGVGVRSLGKGVSISPVSGAAVNAATTAPYLGKKLPLPPLLSGLATMGTGAAVQQPRNPLLRGKQFSALPPSRRSVGGGGGGGGGGNSNPLLQRPRHVGAASRGPAVRRPGGPVVSGHAPPPAKSRKVLSTGEVIEEQQMAACTPYCPGVSGFPELECNGCQTLFHSKCVGISPNVVDKIKATFKCKVCIRNRKNPPPPPQVIDLD